MTTCTTLATREVADRRDHECYRAILARFLGDAGFLGNFSFLGDFSDHRHMIDHPPNHRPAIKKNKPAPTHGPTTVATSAARIALSKIMTAILHLT